MQCPSTAVIVTSLKVIFIFPQVDYLIECLECHEYIPMHEIRQHQNEAHGTKRKVLLPTSDPSLYILRVLKFIKCFCLSQKSLWFLSKINDTDMYNFTITEYPY